MSTRRTQPYRKTKGLLRAPSPTLDAMRRGKTLFGQNPQDVHRLAVKKARRRRRKN